MKAIVVEFLGLPGCGKSTVTELVIKQLNINEKKVASDLEVYDTDRLSSAINLFQALISPEKFQFNYLLLKLLLKDIGVRNISAFFGRYLKLIKLNSNIKRAQRKYDYIILSEGYLQVFCSIFDGKKMTKSIASKFANLISNPLWKCIEVNTSIELSNQRIIERNDANDEWFLLVDERRRNLLENRYAHIELVANTINTHRVQGNLSPQLIASQVLRLLESAYDKTKNN